MHEVLLLFETICDGFHGNVVLGEAVSREIDPFYMIDCISHDFSDVGTASFPDKVFGKVDFLNVCVEEDCFQGFYVFVGDSIVLEKSPREDRFGP